jgi:acyl-CoA thioesterase FadM
MAYFRAFPVRWDDLDVNRHVANTAYAHYMIQTRMDWFGEGGFGQADFEHERIGPAILRDEFHYLHEAPPDAVLRVRLELDGLSADERFIRFAHAVFLPDGGMAVRARCTFCWIHLDTRRVREAPEALARRVRELPRTADFTELRKADAFPVGLERAPIEPLS